MTNVLIPTDFTAASLKLAETALINAELSKCNVILFHAFRTPDLAINLLSISEPDPATVLMNEPFRQACKQLKNQYPNRVGKIVVRCMYGDTRALFRNFVEANDIDLIYCPDNYVFVPSHQRSADPRYLFKKCSVPVIKPGKRKTTQAEVKMVYNDLHLSTP